MMREFLIASVLLIFLSGLGAAESYQFADVETATYGSGNNVNVDIECIDDGSSGSCPSSPGGALSGGPDPTRDYDLNFCGQSIRKSDVASEQFSFSFKVPEDVNCGYGEYGLRLEEVSTNELHASEETLSVASTQENSPHSGKYLYVGMNTKESNVNGQYQIFNMFLSDEQVNGPDYPNGPAVVTTQYYPSSLNSPSIEAYDTSLSADELSQVSFDDSSDTLSGITQFTPSTSDENNNDEVLDIQTRSDGSENYQMRNWMPGSYTPAHYDRDLFVPQGDIIIGAALFSGEGEKFHVCREGATTTGEAGNTVSRIVSTGFGNYKCDQSAGEWQRSYECSDGVDNDGDGYVDYQNDPDCGGNPEGTESEGQCEPWIANSGEDTTETIGGEINNKAAYHDSGQGGPLSPEGTTCNYYELETSVSLDTSQDPVEFECTISGGSAEADYNGPVDNSEADTFCQNRLNVAGDGNSFANGEQTMPAVQYFVPKEVMPTGASEFATPSGFKAYSFQTLHQAETQYSDSDPHEESTWSAEGMTDLDGYQNDNPGNYREAWIVANAGADTEDIISSGETLDSGAFLGGFAGECSGGQLWQKPVDLGEWTCSGAIPWTQEVFLPQTFADSDGEARVGFFVMSYNFKQVSPTDQNSYYQAMQAAGKNPALLETLEAVCWVGQQSDRPSSFSSDTKGSQWFAVEVSNINTGISHPLPVTGTLNMNGNSAYTCSWKYTDSLDRDVSEIGGKEKTGISSSDFESDLTESDMPESLNTGDVNNLGKDRLKSLSDEWAPDSGNYDRQAEPFLAN